MKNLISKSSAYYDMAQLIIAMMYVISLKLIFPVGYLLFTIIFNAIWFLLVKSFVSNMKKSFTILRVNIALGLMSVVFTFLSITLTKMSNGMCFIVALMVGISMICVLFIENKKKIEIIEKISIIKGKENSYKEDTFNCHKLKICTDKETGEDVYIYGKDRYLHILLLGRANCLLMK